MVVKFYIFYILICKHNIPYSSVARIGFDQDRERGEPQHRASFFVVPSTFKFSSSRVLCDVVLRVNSGVYFDF